MARDITEAELLEELRRWSQATPEREPNVVTAKEIAGALGCCKETASLFIDRMLDAGRFESTRTPYVDRTGRRTTTWGYRIKDAI